jgi:hypothetical protein
MNRKIIFKWILAEMDLCMYVCMYKGWAIKSNPCTTTFNDLLGLEMDLTGSG